MMSIAFHQTPEGLSIGVQFNTEKGREDLLLPLAGELEQSENLLDVR